MRELSVVPRLEDGAELSLLQRAVLSHLLKAREYARDVCLEVWQFAVCCRELAANGVTDNDLRWLISKGYIAHAVEQTRPAARRRSFRAVANLHLSDQTCFILTEAGERLALTLAQEQAPAASNGVAPKPTVLAEPMEAPNWDLTSHTLFLRGQVVKHFRGEAPYQEAILCAFQEALWVSCVTIRLPLDGGVCSKSRLHDTVKNLNRSVRPYLRFRQEGSGTRVRWEKLAALPQRDAILTLADGNCHTYSRER